jgi:DNA-binding transcriptional LysR family regulator
MRDLASRPGDLDLDLRLVRYFTVLAEYGNFHRAADALCIAQPSLSRQIRCLEQQMGARLLERSRQGTRLSQAGLVFLPQAQALLQLSRQTVADTRAAVGHDEITIGYIGDLTVTAVARNLRDRRPDTDVRTLHLGAGDAYAALLDRRVDAVIVRRPFPASRLRQTVLYEEPRVLVVPASHRLAARPSVTLDDFADEVLVRYSDPACDAFWSVHPRPPGRPAPDGPLATTAYDKLELVAQGQALAIAPDSRLLSALRPDLATVPITGIEPCQVVLATRADDRSRLIEELRAIAVTRPGKTTAGAQRTGRPAKQAVT